ncbi:MAG TPA: hypothetical protein VKU19_05540 [Bryobacteraceae bacterium]|nr:hypothetical protein [Bryobacteraceae bacterium]
MRSATSSKVKLILIACLLCCSAAGVAVYHSREPHPSIEFTSQGLSSLQFRGVEFLSFGDLRVSRAVMRDSSGRSAPASLDSSLEVDPKTGTVLRRFPWGELSARYTTSPGRLAIAITVTNRSQNTLQEASYEPLGLKFPGKVVEYDGTVPLLGHNYGDPTLIGMSWGTGIAVLANDDVTQPLISGFPWALDRPGNTTFPLRVCTGRDPMLPDMLPYIQRPVAPGVSDTYHLSIRFGSRTTGVSQLGHDVLQRFAEHYPGHLQWKDRRPIGTIFLASSGSHSAKNPRGWLLDPNIDVKSAAGVADLKQKILQLADSTTRILRSMNAQGAITWDIEGEEFPTATYAGDPRQFTAMAPEMAGIADAYFERLRNAGFRVGVCVRPQELVFDPQQQTAIERDTQDPAALLTEKIAWARNRWGATLFYVDTNGDPSRPLDADILEKVAATFPDVLLVPEHKNVRYFAFSAPYFSLHEGLAATPEAIRAVYPNAFSLINTADGPIAHRREELMSAIKHGDILLYRTWYDDPANTEVKSLY